MDVSSSASMELHNMEFANNLHHSNSLCLLRRSLKMPPVKLDSASSKRLKLPKQRTRVSLSQAPENGAAHSSTTKHEPADQKKASKPEATNGSMNHANGVTHFEEQHILSTTLPYHQFLDNNGAVDRVTSHVERGLKVSSLVNNNVDVKTKFHAPPWEAANQVMKNANGNGSMTVMKEVSYKDLSVSTPTKANEGLGIIEFLKGKNILITGATGFLAKVLVEKILRVQPEVEKIYLLIKAKDMDHARHRLQSEILHRDLFTNLRSLHGSSFQDFIEKKVSLVVGNLTNDNLGMDATTMQKLQAKVEIIVNSAASTTFDERYDHALNLNTKGAGRIMEFGHQCPKLQLLMHVSTAYVNGKRKGKVMERAFKLGCSIANESSIAKGLDMVPDIDLDMELQLIHKKTNNILSGCKTNVSSVVATCDTKTVESTLQQAMRELGMERAQKYGWQDTYVFTKALGEMLVDSKRGQVPVVIMRPSVVESSFKDPFPGWMEGNRMMDPIVISYGKGQLPGFLVDPQSVLDVVPVDMVASAMLAAMTKHANKTGLEVYQIASSVVNPLVFRELARMSREHFYEHPFMDKYGNPVVPSPPQLFQDMDSFMSAVATCSPSIKDLTKRHQLLLEKVKQQAAYLVSLYQPYTFYSGRFDTSKTQQLFSSLSWQEKQMFGFDVGEIDWDTYIKSTHIPGLRRHVLKGRGSHV